MPVINKISPPISNIRTGPDSPGSYLLEPPDSVCRILIVFDRVRCRPDGNIGKSAPAALGKCYSIGGVYVSEAVMRAFAIILAVAATAACGAALAQTTTPNVVNPGTGLQTPLTFTTTTCMMNCNSQVASCRTTCFIPAPPTRNPSPSFSPPPILNATPNTACLMGCTSTQLACQSGCALNSPSR